MTGEMTTTNGADARPLATLDPETMEKLVVGGDLSKLTPGQRLQYYRVRCENAGLDPAAQPFQYLVLNSKLVLYATKSCTEQLTAIHGVQLTILEQKTEENVRVVTVRAVSKDGRQSEDIGAVEIGGLRGEKLCNALMKAVTKAKRRTILSLCGLGTLDETEIETVSDARRVRVDGETGEIEQEPPLRRGRSKAGPISSAAPPPDHAEGARMQAEMDSFAGGDAPALVCGVPIVSGKTWEQIADAKIGTGGEKIKDHTWSEYVEAAYMTNKGEKWLRDNVDLGLEMYSNGRDPLQLSQYCALACEALQKRRAADAVASTVFDEEAEQEG